MPRRLFAEAERCAAELIVEYYRAGEASRSSDGVTLRPSAWHNECVGFAFAVSAVRSNHACRPAERRDDGFAAFDP